MPIYEYLCCKCRQEFQLTRLVRQVEEPAFCPGCGAPSRKLISAFASKSEAYIRPPDRPALREYAAVCGMQA